MMLKNSKKAQEEMMGFAIIVIIVAVILLIFLGFSMINRDRDSVESYEAESFLKALLHYTSDCEDAGGPLQIRDLIYKRYEEQECLNGEKSEDILVTTIGDILDESWQVGEDTPIKGYLLNISINGEYLESWKKGNQTYNSKGTIQEFPKSGRKVELIFEVFY